MFAALAQHLRAALVPLDVDAAHGTLLDEQVGVGVGAGPAEGAELGREACSSMMHSGFRSLQITRNRVDYFGLQRYEEE